MIVLDLQKTTNDISQFIFDTLASSGMKKIIVALSGGVDSALSTTLASKLLGKDQIHVVLLPYGKLNQLGIEDAKHVIEKLHIPQEQVHMVDIAPAVEKIVENIYEIDDIRRGNVMARVRMIYLFDLAKKLGALVCGTENKTEHHLGYFTRFGDEASDIEPIRSLYKTQVWELASFVGVPDAIIKKSPTAGLWDGQTDEGELGFSYKDADIVLYYYIDEKLTLDQIVEKGFSFEVASKVIERVVSNEFKHHSPKIFR